MLASSRGQTTVYVSVSSKVVFSSCKVTGRLILDFPIGETATETMHEVTRALRQAKASYFREMFQEVKKTSTYWNLLNKATNSTIRKCIGPLK